MQCMECEFEEVDSCEDNIEFSVDRQEIEARVIKYIENYFVDKFIPLGIDLTSQKYVDLCIETDICNGVDKAYAAMEKCGKFDTSSSDHLISEDIRFVIKTLSQIKRIVPQDFSAGILLMHLEIIEGVSF